MLAQCGCLHKNMIIIQYILQSFLVVPYRDTKSNYKIHLFTFTGFHMYSAELFNSPVTFITMLFFNMMVIDLCLSFFYPSFLSTEVIRKPCKTEQPVQQKSCHSLDAPELVATTPAMNTSLHSSTGRIEIVWEIFRFGGGTRRKTYAPRGGRTKI